MQSFYPRINIHNVEKERKVLLIHKIAVSFVKNAIKFSICKESEHDTYVYGFEIFLGQSITCLLLVFIGMAMRCVFLVTVYVSFLIMLRGQAGGHHAKTHLRCIVTTCFVSIIAVSIAQMISIEKSAYIYPILGVAAIYIAFKAPINHINLDLSQYEIACSRKYVRQVLVIEIIMISVLFVFNITAPAMSASLAIITVAASMVFAKISEQEIKNKEDSHGKLF